MTKIWDFSWRFSTKIDGKYGIMEKIWDFQNMDFKKNLEKCGEFPRKHVPHHHRSLIFEWILIGFLCEIFLDIVYISILDPFVGFIPINLRMCVCVCVGFQPQVTIEISTMHIHAW